DVVALWCRQHRDAACKLEQVRQRARANHARLFEHILVNLVVTRQCARVRARGARTHAGAPGLENDDGHFLGHPFGHLGECAAVLQVLAVLRDDLGDVVLFEEREQIVLVDARLIAETDDRRHAHLGGARKTDDCHADATGLRGQCSLALDVVCRAERGAEIFGPMSRTPYFRPISTNSFCPATFPVSANPEGISTAPAIFFSPTSISALATILAGMANTATSMSPGTSLTLL